MVTEDAASVKWLVETFQKHNPKVSLTRLVMTDKDINEQDVIKLLPHVKVMICLFHSLKTFKREINVEDMNITMTQKNAALEFISKIAYSQSESEFDGVHRNFWTLLLFVWWNIFRRTGIRFEKNGLLGTWFRRGTFLTEQITGWKV